MHHLDQTGLSEYQPRGRRGLPRAKIGQSHAGIRPTTANFVTISLSLPQDPLKAHAHLERYRPYLQVPLITYHGSYQRTELVEGSICQLIMQLQDSDMTLKAIYEELKNHQAGHEGGWNEWGYTIEDISAIIKACKAYGLGAKQALEIDYGSDVVYNEFIEVELARWREMERYRRASFTESVGASSVTGLTRKRDRAHFEATEQADI